MAYPSKKYGVKKRKINFLTGDLIFRKRKTGVHFVHDNLFKKFIQHNDFMTYLSFYKTKKIFYVEYPNVKSDFFCFSNKIARFLAYIVPIKYIFGCSDIYVCDGIVPRTVGKKICIVHDLMVFRFPQYYSLLMKIYLKIYFKQLKRADKILAVSHTTKKDLINYLGIESNKISVVYPGVDIPRYSENSNLSLNLPQKYLFFIGDSRKNKNLSGAIHGFAQYIKNSNDELYFVIAGGGDKKELKNIISELGIEQRIIFLGYITEKEKGYLYKNCYAFVFVSFFEGFGIPVLEAMSYGAPIITSNISSMAEIANGYAILVNPYDYNSISQGIAKMSDEGVRNKYAALGKVCVKKYSWEQAYQDMKSAIDETLKE